MDYFSLRYLIWATALGGLSAFSLPLGSAVGLLTRPRPQVISVLQTFGAGALLAALSVELVAPTLFALNGDSGAAHQGDPHTNFYALVGGAAIGGILFFLLDQLVNSHGGFLRKTSTSIAYFRIDRRKRQKVLLEKLSQFPLLQNLSSEHISTLIDMVRPLRFNDGDVIYNQGDTAREVAFILSGAVIITDDGQRVAELAPGGVTGLGALVLDTPLLAAATASGDVKALVLSRDDFNRLRQISSEFDRASRELTDEHIEYAKKYAAGKREKAERWLCDAAKALKTAGDLPNVDQLRRAREEHKGAPLAVWLGMVIDGIPESFVIGAGLLVALQAWGGPGDTVTFGDIIPFTLIAGLFLSNFPEALASSANMRLQGWRKRRIFMLWVSLFVITAVGAGVGFVAVESLNHT